MTEDLENFDRRIAKIVRDRLKLPSPMPQMVRETFHEYVRYMINRTRDDIRQIPFPLFDRVTNFLHDHTITTDDWTMLARLGFDKDYETHAKLRGYTRLSEFVRDLDRDYRSRMLDRARGAIPKVWRERLRAIRD